MIIHRLQIIMIKEYKEYRILNSNYHCLNHTYRIDILLTICLLNQPIIIFGFLALQIILIDSK